MNPEPGDGSRSSELPTPSAGVTRPVMSTPLRVFIGLSIILHLVLVGMVVVPSILGLFRKQEVSISEEEILLRKQQVVEKVVQETTSEAVEKELTKALKENLRDVAGMPPAAFEMFWTNSLAALQTNIESSAEALAKSNLAELTPSDLEEAMRNLREAAMDALMTKLAEETKDEIAAQVLSSVAQTLPEFNQKTQDLMSQAESTKALAEMEKLLAEERARRLKEIATATTSLSQAQQQIDQAAARSTSIEQELARTLGDNKKRTEAAIKADASVAQALRAADEAMRQTATLDAALAAKAAADEAMAGSQERLKEASKNQADPGNALAGAKEAIQSASAQAKQAAKGVAEAQKAVHTALDGAAKELRGTATPLTDKAELPVASALGAAARLTDAVVAGPVKRTGELAAANSIAAALKSSAQTRAAVSNLVNDLTRARSELSNMIGGPTVEEVKVAATARGNLETVMKTLGAVQDHLEKASTSADKGSAMKSSRAIGQMAKEVRDTGDTSIAHAADALSTKPADPQIPQSGPRPGRKDIAIAQRDMESATNRLSSLSRQMTVEKQSLGRSALEFENNVAQSVSAALTEDPVLREKTREFVRQTLREQVATEFRGRAEELAGKVLAKKGMEHDDNFVKRVGREAADLLLEGSESNLMENAFAEVMGQTARKFGVKPSAMRGALPAGKRAPDAEEGMEAVETAMEGSLTKSLRSGTKNALSAGAKSSLRLPGTESFGATRTDAMRERLAGARGGAARALATGGRESLIAGMSDKLAQLGMKLKSASSGRKAYLDNPAEYRRNLETVIHGREVKEVVLVAPSLTNVVAVATSEIVSNRPALMLVGSRRAARQTPTNTVAKTERTLIPPDFKAFAYGGAPFATNAPVIDGDLSEWSGVRPFALRGVIEKGYWNKAVPAAWETNRYLMVQWDYSGFYFAYQMVDDEDDTNIDRKNFWEGDCLELWVDLSNRRSDTRAEDQQQFWFWPLGSRREPGSLGGELIMPGQRTEMLSANATGSDAPRMAVKRTVNPRGYQVEIYLPLARLRNGNLTPGRIIAFNYSTDNGNNAYFWWTTELGKAASMTPSTWGDLILLGADAAITAVKPGKTAGPLAAIMPGEPFGVRVADIDMNIDPRVRNQVKVKFESSSGQTLIGYLEETEVNSGLFEGSVDTVEILPDEEQQAANNALPVVAGGMVEVSYFDQARRYGERNFTLQHRIPIGVPVMRMSAAGTIKQ